ncbi:MAG: helix-turn-helix transcriptional regulator [Rhodospirillales bacterium]|nr:helix-turn-helix transcriptional regulator [Rhodospirillales bacterium]
MSDELESRGGRPRPDAVDMHVGARLRERRLKLGMSQERLADSVGLTFQQIQKYERGVNRMGASRLWELARALEVPLEFFYRDDDGPFPAPSRPAFGFADRQDAFGDAPGLPDDARELLDAYARITDRLVRQRVLELVKSLAPATRPRD